MGTLLAEVDKDWLLGFKKGKNRGEMTDITASLKVYSMFYGFL